MDTEASLATAIRELETCQKAKMDTTKQLKNAERQLELARTEVETYQIEANRWQKAKVAVEELIAKEKRFRASQRQEFLELQQTLQETEEQLEDAKSRHRETLAEKERCQNAKNNVERELERSKQKIESAYLTLLIMLLAFIAIIFWMGSSWSVANNKVSNRMANYHIHRDS